MTSLVHKSQMVGEAVAKSSEGLSRIHQKSKLIQNHVDDANRIMRRMCVSSQCYNVLLMPCNV